MAITTKAGVKKITENITALINSLRQEYNEPQQLLWEITTAPLRRPSDPDPMMLAERLRRMDAREADIESNLEEETPAEAGQSDEEATRLTLPTETAPSSYGALEAVAGSASRQDTFATLFAIANQTSVESVDNKKADPNTLYQTSLIAQAVAYHALLKYEEADLTEATGFNQEGLRKEVFEKRLKPAITAAFQGPSASDWIQAAAIGVLGSLAVTLGVLGQTNESIEVNGQVLNDSTVKDGIELAAGGTAVVISGTLFAHHARRAAGSHVLDAAEKAKIEEPPVVVSTSSML